MSCHGSRGILENHFFLIQYKIREAVGDMSQMEINKTFKIEKNILLNPFTWRICWHDSLRHINSYPQSYLSCSFVFEALILSVEGFTVDKRESYVLFSPSQHGITQPSKQCHFLTLYRHPSTCLQGKHTQQSSVNTTHDGTVTATDEPSPTGQRRRTGGEQDTLAAYVFYWLEFSKL